MLIGEVSEKTGVSKDTIRYYEKLGFFKVSKKARRDNNYKEYPQEVIEKLEIIKRAKHLGFTLSEIQEFMDSWLNKTLSNEERIALFDTRINLINSKIKALEEVREHIERRIREIKGGLN